MSGKGYLYYAHTMPGLEEVAWIEMRSQLDGASFEGSKTLPGKNGSISDDRPPEMVAFSDSGGSGCGLLAENLFNGLVDKFYERIGQASIATKGASHNREETHNNATRQGRGQGRSRGQRLRDNDPRGDGCVVSRAKGWAAVSRGAARRPDRAAVAAVRVPLEHEDGAACPFLGEPADRQKRLSGSPC